MSIADKFRTWSEMDTEDDFIQYLERLVSGDPALSAASTASSRTKGINRPLARLAHNTDALCDALVAAESKFLIPASGDEVLDSTYIEFDGSLTSNQLTFSGTWKILGMAPVEDTAVGITIPDAGSGTVVNMGGDNVVYAVVDRTAGTAPSVTLQTAAGFEALSTIISGASDKLSYIFIGYSVGTAGNKSVFRLFNGITIRSRERYYGHGHESFFATAAVSRQNSGNSATIQCEGEVSWNASTATLGWDQPLKFFIPGSTKHETSGTAGTFSFTGTSRFLYFIPDRNESTVVSIDVATELLEAESRDIDVWGHDGVDFILVGRVNHDNSCFIFSNGQVLNDGTVSKLERSPVETLTFRDDAGTATDTIGNVELKVKAGSGLDIETTTTAVGTHTAEITMETLWHTRSLTALSTPLDIGNTAVVQRVVVDSSSPDGHLFLTHDYVFAVPGYNDGADPVLFSIILKGDSSHPGLNLSDSEFAWIILPDRASDGDAGISYFNFTMNAGETANTSQIQHGHLEDFPHNNPNAYIIAHRPDTDATWAGGTRYNFLDLKGIRDGASIPLFSADRYHALVRYSQDITSWQAGADMEIEFGWDETGVYTSAANMYYIRFVGTDTSLGVFRNGFNYTKIIAQGTGVDNGTGATGKVVWERANATAADRDMAVVYTTWDEEDIDSGNITRYFLSSSEDEDIMHDDVNVLFGKFYFGYADSGTGTASDAAWARFCLWDGTQLDLDKDEVFIRYSGTPSRLNKDIHRGLISTLDGTYTDNQPGRDSRFITKGGLDDHGSGSSDGGAQVKSSVAATAFGPYVPFLNFDKVEQETGGFEGKAIYQVMSGFDHIFTDSLSTGIDTDDDGSHDSFGADRIAINSGMCVFGDTFIADTRGGQIEISDSNYWIGSSNNSSLANYTHRANHCIELRESVWFGHQGGYGNATHGWDGNSTGAVTSVDVAKGHFWRVKSGVSANTAPFCVRWGRNYIYMRPDADYTIDTGNGKLCSRAEYKLSKWPPSFSTTSTKQYGQGTRNFTDSLHSDGYGDDEGVWLCIGSCFMYAEITEAQFNAASTFQAFTGSDNGTGASPQKGGFSTSTNYLNSDHIKAIGFTKTGTQVTLESPLPIHYNSGVDDTVWQDGVKCRHPSWGGSATNIDPADHEGGYDPDKGHFPNTGVRLDGSSGGNNGVGVGNGASLNLEPLLPELPIGKVDFTLSWGLQHPGPSGDTNQNEKLLAIKQALKGRVKDTSSSETKPSTWTQVRGPFLRSFYFDQLYHTHEVDFDLGEITSSSSGHQHGITIEVEGETEGPSNHQIVQACHLDFSMPGMNQRRALLFRTENNASVDVIFASVDRLNADENYEGSGFFITGWTESISLCTTLDLSAFNVDIDEDNFDDSDGTADIQGKYGTWDDS